MKIDNSALVPGIAYTITALDNIPQSQWIALGVQPAVTPAVGVSFVALNAGPGSNSSSARVMATAPLGSNICSIETVGDPNLSIAPSQLLQNYGASFILQCRDYQGAAVLPADGSVISLAFLLNNSGEKLQGE